MCVYGCVCVSVDSTARLPRLWICEFNFAFLHLAGVNLGPRSKEY